MATKFIESGTAATQDFSFYTAGGGTGVRSSSTQAVNGSTRSFKCSLTNLTDYAYSYKSGILADAGRRITCYVRFDKLPVGATDLIMVQKVSTAAVFSVGWDSSGNMRLLNSLGASVATGTSVLAINTDYRISVAYTITSALVNTISVYLNGVLELTATNINTSTGSDTLMLGAGPVSTSNYAASANIYFAHIYVDDGSSGDVGNVLVTAKRPNANGTVNNFVTQIGAGGSGYGTGHSPQVNERPLSLTNGWSIAASGSAVTEEYNIESQATGDIDLTGHTLVDYAGWVYAKSLSSETAQIILNNVTYNVSLTSSAALFTAFAASATYPASTGTDIGLVTDTTVTTVSLYESGIVFAYLPIAPTVTSTSATWKSSTSFTGAGNVTSDGGGAITERGIVVGTSANPTTSNSKFTTSGTTGSFSVDATGLTAGTLYHMRAYATNSIGTSYGTDLSIFVHQQQDRLLLEDNASFLLQEDNSSKLLLDDTVELDTPLNAGTVTSVTPALSFFGKGPIAENLTYEIEVDTANTFNSTVVGTTPAIVALVQNSSSVHSSATPTGILPSSSTAGNLLIVCIQHQVSAGTVTSGPAGWNFVVGQPGANLNVEIWAYPNNPGGISNAAFTAASGTWQTVMYEFSGADTITGIDTSGSNANTASATLTVTTTGNISSSNEAAVALGYSRYTTASSRTITLDPNWTRLFSDTGLSQAEFAEWDYKINPPSGSTLTNNFASTATPQSYTGVIAVIKAGTVNVLGPLLDKTSDLNIGFADATAGDIIDSDLMLEDGTSHLLLEDNSSKLVLNQSFPSDDYVIYSVPASTLSNGVTYYWRARRDPVTAEASYGEWSEIKSFTVSTGTSIAITQVAATVTASGGAQVVASSQFVAISQVAATVTATGGTQLAQSFATVAQVAANVTATGGTQAIATVNIVAISQVAGSVTAAGGTQVVATSNFVAIAQAAATVTASGGTQVVQTNAIIAQLAASVTATGGTQVIATSNFVAITQVAGTVTASGGTQVVAAVQNASITQVAASVTASGGTQTVATVNIVAISQVAGNVTVTGGTQLVQSNSTITQVAATVTATGGTQLAQSLASIAQVAANVTASGGTQVIDTVNIVSITQIAGSVTASGGTQVIATSNFVAITQIAGNVTATGGTQVVSTVTVGSVAITQLAGSVTATGGTQAIDTVNIVSITQIAGSVTAFGGTQAIDTINDVAINQLAGSVTASGGTQVIDTSNFVAITQLAGSVTASGGTQSLTAQIDAAIAQLAANVTVTGGTQSISASSNINNASIDQVGASVIATGGQQVITTSTGPLPRTSGQPFIFLVDGQLAIELDKATYIPV